MLRGSQQRRFQRAERGAAAIEFALVLPLLVMLLMGTVTGGMTYYQKISMADAAREAARFGATADVAKTPNWASTVRTRAVTAATGVLDPAPAPNDPKVCVQFYKTGVVATTAGECINAPTPPSSATAGTGCVVRVYASKPASLDIGIMSWPLTLDEEAFARYERAC